MIREHRFRVLSLMRVFKVSIQYVTNEVRDKPELRIKKWRR